MHGDTGSIAPFNKISLSLSLTSLDSFSFKTGELGDFPFSEFSRKGISNLLNKRILFSLLGVLLGLDWLETELLPADSLC